MGCGTSRSLPITPEEGVSVTSRQPSLGRVAGVEETNYSSPDHVSEPIEGIGGGGGGGGGQRGILKKEAKDMNAWTMEGNRRNEGDEELNGISPGRKSRNEPPTSRTNSGNRSVE